MQLSPLQGETALHAYAELPARPSNSLLTLHVQIGSKDISHVEV